MSAGISIRDSQTDEEIVTMDIDMRPIHYSTMYKFGNNNIAGVLVNEIISDKITRFHGVDY